MQRIKRNSIYYTYGAMQNCWCRKCYAKLKEGDPILLDDGSEISKSRLIEAKHDSQPEETWIQCSDCKADLHQICALYSDRMRKAGSKPLCPRCVLVNRDPDGGPSEFSWRASDLQKCTMDMSMEAGLKKTLAKAYEDRAAKLGVHVSDIEKAKGLSIRVLSHIEKKQSVRDGVSYLCFACTGPFCILCGTFSSSICLLDVPKIQ